MFVKEHNFEKFCGLGQRQHIKAIALAISRVPQNILGLYLLALKWFFYFLLAKQLSLRRGPRPIRSRIKSKLNRIC